MFSDPDRDCQAIMKTGLLANGERVYAPNGKPLPFLNNRNQPVYLSESFARAMWTAYSARNVFVDFSGISGWLASLEDYKRPEARPGAMELYVNNCICKWNRKDNLPADSRNWKEILAAEQGREKASAGSPPQPGPACESGKQENGAGAERGRAKRKYLARARKESEWQESQMAVGSLIFRALENIENGNGGQYAKTAC